LAAVPHTVQPGETLWSIAAASNFTTRALAAANGLPETAQVVAGSTIQVPSEAEAAAALAGTGVAPAQPAGTASAPAPAAPSEPTPGPMGAYSVEPGDTLSGIAASSGIGVSQLAWMNGIDPGAPLLIGTVLKLPTGASLASEQPAPPAVPSAVPNAEPYATPGQVTAEQIGGIAASHGVPPALAAAVAWQESGFNNGLVSAANARGVMQILPGTWTWVQDQLAGGPLDPGSPTDNVHAGVMYLGQLLRDSGGDQARAAAAYYQGWASVSRDGLLPETQQYVDNVMSLQSRFGGP
jgi:soluble lytic murein transglycosylase-like protein